ncbi:MAG TPA: TonB-dependent receptor [Bacteroidales bacterium]|nr:TonB-dependent receptor [Bacteroidales bacterium]
MPSISLRRLTVFCLIILPSGLFAQKGSISGYVKGMNGEAIEAVTLVIKNTTLGTVTDRNGFYKINNINAGTYIVRASLIGYETREKTVTVLEGENNADFGLDETNINLNEVVVTGTRSEKALKNVPVITQVINARRMIDLGITSVTGALQNMVPGLEIGQFGTRATVTMQGMDAKYVLFLVDGERIAGEISGDIDYSMLNLENIDRIEVIKGASSSLYGSNAIGGVINIITKKIDEPFDARIYSRYSKYNEFTSGGGISFKRGMAGSRTSFNYSHHDGYDITPETPFEWTQNPYNSFSVNQKFEITPSPDFSFSPYFGYYRFERGNVSARPVHDLYTDFKAGLKGEYYFREHSLDFSYYRDRYNTFNVFELLDNLKDTASYDIIQTVRTQGNFKISEKNSLTAGLEYNHEKLLSDRIEEGIKNAGEAVFYVQEDISPGKRWNIIAGVRVSYHSNYGFNAAPKISLMFKSGFGNLRASAGTGFRSPALKELYMNFDHFGEWYLMGNPELGPESSLYVSGSYEFSRPWNNSSVSVYHNSLSNMITDRWLPDTVRLTRQYENVASASVSGIDFLSKQKIFKGLWISVGYNYVQSHDNETGLQLYGTTKHSGNISSDYNFRKKNYSLTVQLLCKLTGEKFYEITSEGIDRDRPFSTWRLTLSQEYKWLRLTTGVDNIFNLVIPYNNNYISPGRRFFIGTNIDFGKIR